MAHHRRYPRIRTPGWRELYRSTYRNDATGHEVRNAAAIFRGRLVIAHAEKLPAGPWFMSNMANASDWDEGSGGTASVEFVK